jgi:hypothetical protein
VLDSSSRTEEVSVTVQSQVFQSATISWEQLCQEAAAFATSLGRDRLINISVAAAGGGDLFGVGGKGVIVVWYWA